MFRLLPLLVFTLGVASARRPDHHGNASPKHPITARHDQQRICADLCSSGLGGDPCGDVCFDLMPTGIPLQSSNTTRLVQNVKPRQDVCPLLCANRLGYPLCNCQQKRKTKKQNVDFKRICDFYCVKQKWALRGCPDCPGAKPRQDGRLFRQDGDAVKMANVPGTTFTAYTTPAKVDWDKWCYEQCANSNGGSACNCDLLPFAL